MADRTKVAILGGGMGSLVTAWELAKRGDFEITVYQRDHVLGGKGASVRNREPGFGERIEEHGIHILMGWYEDSIRTLREVYRELDDAHLPPGLGRPLPWDDVLLPHDRATMAESPDLTGESWDFWTVTLPQRRGFPGDGNGVHGFAKLIVILVRWLARLRGRTFSGFAGVSDPPAILATFPYDPAMSDEDYVRADDAIAEAEAEELFGRFQELDVAEQLRLDAESLAAVFGENQVASLGGDPVPPGRPNRRVERWFMAYWFAQAMVRGLFAERVLSRADFARFDHVDLAAWLREHGGYPRSAKEFTWDSPLVRILYDLAFGRGQAFAAGVWAWAVLLFAFAYKGSFVYWMNGGMGDIVFAPLYLALSRRGVKFRFLHEVQRIEAHGERVRRIHLIDRGRLPADYCPLFGVERKGHGPMPSWPDRPLVEPGEASPVVLEAGRDFDEVVLGIGVGGLEPICRDLLSSGRFRSMLENASTIATQAAQFWLHRECGTLGWHADELVACYVRPFNSCVQMNHVLLSETWTDDDDVAACVYLCDQAEDGTTKEQVRESLRQFLGSEGRHLLGRFEWSDLHDPLGENGESRVKSQYFRANTEGSDRYVITPPGSPQFRLAPGDSGFHNLVLAGDWVKTDINAGCLEAATRGGLGAAAALVARR